MRKFNSAKNKIRKVLILYLLLLNSCVWDMIPSYSPYWDEDLWFHKENKKPLPKNIDSKCYQYSLSQFKTKRNEILDRIEIINEEDKIRSDRIYGICLKDKGYIFNPSYKFCYRFKSYCESYNEFR